MANTKRETIPENSRREFEDPGFNSVIKAGRSMKDHTNDLEFDLLGGDPLVFLDRSNGIEYLYDDYDGILVDGYEYIDELRYEGSEDFDTDEFCFDEEY